MTYNFMNTLLPEFNQVAAPMSDGDYLAARRQPLFDGGSRFRCPDDSTGFWSILAAPRTFVWQAIENPAVGDHRRRVGIRDGATMRGEHRRQETMFRNVSPEARVPERYPLRAIRAMGNQALAALDA